MPSAGATPRRAGQGARLALCALIAVAAFIAYWPVLGHEFLLYDDSGYVSGNTRVQAGLTLENVRWAFTTGAMANWHPLTWLSHMLDCTLFGLDAGRHHLVNLLLHVANAILLLLVLEAMTGALLPSALTAALFALHPLHVESVAWVAERRDALSTLFWILTMVAYVRWVRAPGPGRYALVASMLALGLMSKPMLVTLPFVLLLLDEWPLRRSAKLFARRVWEKVPLFALAATASVVTFIVQRASGAVRSTSEVPLVDRLANAALAIVTYLGKTAWPTDLACFYPFKRPFVVWQVAAAVLLLAAISVATWIQRKRRPYLLVGWLWFLGTLVPVIGIVQVGPQAMADRYTYVPLIGIFIALAWGGADVLARWRVPTVVGVVAGLVVLAASLILTRDQVGYWRDGVVLFEHALDVTGGSNIAHINLGAELERRSRADEAIAHYREAIRITPNFVEAHQHLARALGQQGELAEATEHYEEAVRYRPGDASALFELGTAFWREGRVDEAIKRWKEALVLAPDHAEAHNNLGVALVVKGRFDEAAAEYTEALRLRADYIDAHVNLAALLRRQSRLEEAIAHYQDALAIDPARADAHYGLANVLAQQGKVEAAIDHYRQALRARPEFADAHNNLGLVLVQQGRAEEAIEHYTEAIRVNPRFAQAYYNRGIARRQRGEGEAAEADLEQARALDPRAPR